MFFFANICPTLLRQPLFDRVGQAHVTATSELGADLQKSRSSGTGTGSRQSRSVDPPGHDRISPRGLLKVHSPAP